MDEFDKRYRRAHRPKFSQMKDFLLEFKSFMGISFWVWLVWTSLVFASFTFMSIRFLLSLL